MKIEDEINQRSFDSHRDKAAMNILLTANWVDGRYAAVLKPLGISLQQLNVLSILKGQPANRATVSLIKDRMIDRMPNVSRMLNKLMEKGLIDKERQSADQRVVYIHLTAKGKAAAKEGRRLFRSVTFNLTEEKALALSELLDAFRR